MSEQEKLVWRKSTRSQISDCVETAIADGLVVVRNSRDRDGVSMSFTPNEWKAFVAGVKAGEFDLDDAGAEFLSAVDAR